MSHSNRTSFMTADTGSARNSMGSTIEKDLQYPFYSNRHHHISHQVDLSKHDGELPRHKSVLRKKTNIESQHNYKPAYNNDYDIPHRASFSSESLESSHTVINESSQSSYNLKEKNILPNAELNPRNTTPETITPELKTYPIAWVLLFSIVVLRAATAIFGNTFSPIPSVTAEFMGISLSSINWIYNVMSICYIVASFFTSWLYLVIGVKWSVSANLLRILNLYL